MSKEKRKRSKVWKNFDYRSKTLARCKHCLVDVCRTNGGTSNMRRHLLQNHGSKCLELQTGTTDQDFLMREAERLAYELIKNFDALDMPWSDEKDKEKFLADPKHHEATSAAIICVIDRKFSRYCDQLAGQIKHLQWYSLSFNLMCDERNRNFLVLTLHFSETKLTLDSRVLNVLEVDDSWSVDHLIELIENSLKMWGVEKEKVVALVTSCDGLLQKAALAFVEPKKHIFCLAQLVDGVVESALSGFTREARTFEKLRNIFTCVVSKQDQPKNFQSSLHASALSNEQSKSKKCHSLSFLKLVKLYFHAQHAVDPRLDGEGFNEKEVSFLQDLAALGEPFLALVTEITTPYCIKSSVILPLLNSTLKAIRSTVVQSDSGIFMQNLIIAEFLSLFLELTNKEVLALSTALDPVYKTLHLVTKKSLELVSTALEKCLLDNTSQLRNEEHSRKTPKPIWAHHESLCEKFAQHFHSVEFETYLSMPLCSSESDAVFFWKINKAYFPKLSQLAKKFQCVPATSFLPETVFSEVRSSLSRKLTKLDSGTIEKYLVLHNITIEEWEALSN